MRRADSGLSARLAHQVASCQDVFLPHQGFFFPFFPSCGLQNFVLFSFPFFSLLLYLFILELLFWVVPITSMALIWLCREEALFAVYDQVLVTLYVSAWYTKICHPVESNHKLYQWHCRPYTTKTASSLPRDAPSAAKHLKITFGRTHNKE